MASEEFSVNVPISIKADSRKSADDIARAISRSVERS
jgi:hypothetical protein